jgi:hypothetical protein
MNSTLGVGQCAAGEQVAGTGSQGRLIAESANQLAVSGRFLRIGYMDRSGATPVSRYS